MILEVENINCFYGLSHVVRDLSLQVDAGEIVSLLGRNGAGKTTTIQAIVGLVRPRSGKIFLMTSPIAGRPPYEIYRRGVGWVPQGRRLFPDPDRRREYPPRHAQRCGGEPVERTRTCLRSLSDSGRNAAKRALAVSPAGSSRCWRSPGHWWAPPRVLLLDEPTEGLSPSVIRDLMHVIADVAAQGVAVLLAEQNIRVALASASRHYILDRGEIRSITDTADPNELEGLVARHLGVAVGTNEPGS